MGACHFLLKLDQNDALECAAGRFRLVLGLGGSDGAETEHSRRNAPEALSSLILSPRRATRLENEPNRLSQQELLECAA